MLMKSLGVSAKPLFAVVLADEEIVDELPEYPEEVVDEVLDNDVLL